MLDPLASRVAARFLIGTGYFAVNDAVLYGKYKNKRGKIVGFGSDKWGNPTIEVEPVPKGRKQNKVFGLYKVWRADVKEKALAEQAAQAAAGGAPTAAQPPEDDQDDDEDFDLVAHVATVFADLHPPLGKPGGPCQVIERIERNVRSPGLKDNLVEDVNHGQDLSNSDASKVYPILAEHGVGPIKQVHITSHGQYRMDLRGISVDDVRRAIGSFLQQMGEWKVKKNPAYERMGTSLERGEKLEWVDPKSRLKIVLAPTGGGSATLISTFWKGRPDPAPPQGSCALPHKSAEMDQDMKTAERVAQRYLEQFDDHDFDE